MNLSVLCSLCFAKFVSIYLFLSGFLLTRTELPNQSECLNVSGQSPCVLEESYSRVIVLLVDAFRYDFAVWNETLSESDALPYQNRMPNLHNYLHKHSKNAKLFKIYADPPTTTMQRIKAITTGSLPTFVEAGSNFNCDEIREDNLISQMIKNNKKVVFVGDDTWAGLFPSHFNRSYFYPSLDVADLDTVDRGVFKHLPEEMEKSDWSLLIGHMLGVDHCGHTFGPLTNHIRDKLSEIDQFIDSVIKSADEDTLILAFGDHGMTITGDHGGDSEDETDAALFAYSPKGFYEPRNESRINQIDLTSTICLLVDVPVPFGSLGTPITELFHTKTEHQEYNILSKAYQQSIRYIHQYGDKDFVNQFNITDEDVKNVNNLRAYFERVRFVLRSVWAQFNLFVMRIGLFLSISISVLIGVRCLEIYQLALSILLAAFCTSNSFIIMEDQISLFLTQLVTCAFGIINKDVINRRHVMLIGVQLLLSRVSFELRRCRPEQFWCYTSGRKDNSAQSVNISILMIIISVAIFGWKNRKSGKSIVERFTMTLIGPTVIAIWISWILPVVPPEMISKHTESSKLSAEIFHRLAEYAGRFALLTSTSGMFLGLFQLPVSISKLDARPASTQTGIVVKMEGARVELTGMDRPLDTARSIQLVWTGLLWSILLGPSLSISSSLLFLDLVILEELIRTGCKWNSVLITRAWLMSNLFFYASGHTTTISGIQFNSTTVGFKTHKTQILPFLMVIFNTYGAQIMSFQYLTKSGNIVESFGNIISCNSIRICGTFLAGFLHRRHLMVWNVFAPRIIFESVNFIVTAVFAALFISANKSQMNRLDRMKQNLNLDKNA